jgi:hypothetical protein
MVWVSSAAYRFAGRRATIFVDNGRRNPTQPTRTNNGESPMTRPRIISWSTIAATMLVGAAIIGCEDDLAARADSKCFTILSDVTSPGPGVVTLTGHFFDSESVLIRDASTNNLLASGTPSTDRSTFTFTGIPSGSQSLDIVVSCDGGQQDMGTRVLTVK